MTSVYDIDRVITPPAPEEFPDDVSDAHFVPAPCQVGCPVGTDAPSYIAYIWEGKNEEAFEAITATNPFSSICGRVCDAPCEPVCRRTDSDGPLAIRNLKRYVMEQLGKDHHLPAVEVTRKETIGIVGAGPAGLTAAQDLAEAGFEVHVYEMSDRPGGMMVWGIPAFRLPPGTVEEDMNRMLNHCPGIKIHVNTALGKDITLDALKEKHDAVVLTIGAWWGKTMDIPGADDDRIVDGVGYLRRINAGERPASPETVLVIGGGDVAMDACRVAKRLPGCKKVKVIYRRGPDEIPARRDELEGAIAEDVEIIYNTQPVEVISDGGRFALRCVETRLGEPEEDGRRRPENVPGSERDFECGQVILAVGQKSESEELASQGLMEWDRVRTSWDTMRTGDDKVFAAGDGAFGGSTIVMAMQHGHRVAYYVRGYLDGIEEPLPYRTPFRTRRVPVAQDVNWEVFNRFEQPFHGLGDDPVAFPEIESTYTPEEAKNEAARCYRCDAETGSSDYSVRNREDIFVMARTNPNDARTQKAMLRKHLQLRDDPFADRPDATLEDLIFLPANLSRLVIDPYRDACNVATDLFWGALRIESPFVVTGFDEAPEEIRRALAEGIDKQGSVYLGRTRLGADSRYIQLVRAGADQPDPDALGHVIVPTNGDLSCIEATVRTGSAGLGLAVSAADLEAAIPRALEAGFDMMVLTGNGPIDSPWPELDGAPDLSVMRDAIRIFRKMNREEDLELVYFGGIRSGTDGAKLIGMGANAVALGASMAFALGGQMTDERHFVFHSDYSHEDRVDGSASLLRALSGEASIMARCTGKTNVHNLEPEDLRSITLQTTHETGIPLAGANPKFAESV